MISKSILLVFLIQNYSGPTIVPKILHLTGRSLIVKF